MIVLALIIHLGLEWIYHCLKLACSYLMLWIFENMFAIFWYMWIICLDMCVSGKVLYVLFEICYTAKELSVILTSVWLAMELSYCTPAKFWWEKDKKDLNWDTLYLYHTRYLYICSKIRSFWWVIKLAISSQFHIVTLWMITGWLRNIPYINYSW